MSNWTEETAQITTIDDHGDVRIVNVRRLVPDDPRDEPVQLKPVVEDIGYHDDDEEIDAKVDRAHRHEKLSAADRKKRHDRMKGIVKLAREGVTPRMSKAEHERLKAGDEANREMAAVRRGLVLPSERAETKNAAIKEKP